MQKNCLLFILIITFLLFLSRVSNCQETIFKHYGIKEGLPSSNTYHVFQDSKGYIWIATKKGVSKFSGYEFKNFDSQDGLADNTIFEIYEDNKERIWFIPISCQLSYYKNDSIYKYKYNNVIKDIGKNILPVKRSFYVDSIDNVYFSIKNRGLFKIDENGNIINLTKQFYQFDKINNKILCSHKGNFKSNKLFINSNNSYTINQNDNLQGDGTFGEIINKNTLIINTKNKIYKISKNKIQKEKKLSKQIIWLNKDNCNNIWVGTIDGVYKFDKDLNYENSYLEGQYVSSVQKDKEGSYWFSTLLHGIYYMPSDKIQILNKKHGLIENKINYIKKGKNDEIWLTYSNSYISNIKNKKIKHYKIPDDKKISITSILYEKSTDKLLYSTNKKLMWLKNNKLNTYSLHNIINQDIYPKDIAKTKDAIWVATSSGLLKIKDNKIIYNSKKESELSNRTQTLFLDKDESLLIGGLNNLWQYKNNKLINLSTNNPDLNTRITAIKRVNKTTIALGTKGDGLLLYKKDTIIRISKKDRLLSNFINAIYVDDSTIWVATNYGLSKIQYTNYNNYKIQNFSDYNGFSAKEVNDVCVVNNTVYAASNNGLIYFDKTRITQNNYPPPIIIKNIKILNKAKKIQPTYKLSYKENYINIDYIGLSYRKVGNLQYKYRMIGIDTNWIYTTKTTVQYTTLPHGHYTFEVSAMNEDNIWSTEPARINFNISPPVYKRWWFIILTIIIVTGILYLIYYNRITEIKNKNKLKNNINEYKQQILRQQMNPHFIFNTLNSIQYFLLEKDTDSSLDYLSKFAKLMRLILENTQHTVIAIDDEINALELYLELESLRFEDNFSFNINIDNRINTLDWKMPALLLQPYVENSIKHGFTKILDNKKGLISIDMTLVNNHILCSVEDNGIGRKKANIINLEKSNTHKSLGSKITADRVYLLNSLYGENINVKYIDKKDDNNQAQGTRVEIIIPVII